MVRTWAISAQATATAAVITVATARSRAAALSASRPALSAPSPVSSRPTTVMVVTARAVTVSTRASDLAGVSSAASSSQAWSARVGGGPRPSPAEGPGADEVVRAAATGARAGHGHLEGPRTRAPAQ